MGNNKYIKTWQDKHSGKPAAPKKGNGGKPDLKKDQTPSDKSDKE